MFYELYMFSFYLWSTVKFRADADENGTTLEGYDCSTVVYIALQFSAVELHMFDFFTLGDVLNRFLIFSRKF